MLSRNLIGALPAALVGLANKHHGLVLDIVNRLKDERQDETHRVLATALAAMSAQKPEPMVELPPLLVFDEARHATVDLSNPQDPQAFWQTTKEPPARYLWGLFLTHVVARATRIQPAGIVKVPYADLPRNATGREIMNTPRIDFNSSSLCPILADMISKQPNGEYLEHGLLNDGRANLFRCGSVLVRVHWGGVSRDWSVSDWLPGLEVGAGRRVFSGNLIH